MWEFSSLSDKYARSRTEWIVRKGYSWPIDLDENNEVKKPEET